MAQTTMINAQLTRTGHRRRLTHLPHRDNTEPGARPMRGRVATVTFTIFGR